MFTRVILHGVAALCLDHSKKNGFVRTRRPLFKHRRCRPASFSLFPVFNCLSIRQCCRIGKKCGFCTAYIIYSISSVRHPVSLYRPKDDTHHRTVSALVVPPTVNACILYQFVADYKEESL
jgi:hypothetical protein